MSRFTGYVIHQDGEEGERFGIVEETGLSPSVLLPLSNGKFSIELIGMDGETVRNFRKRHLSDVGDPLLGNPGDLRPEAYAPPPGPEVPFVEPTPVVIVDPTTLPDQRREAARLAGLKNPSEPFVESNRLPNEPFAEPERSSNETFTDPVKEPEVV